MKGELSMDGEYRHVTRVGSPVYKKVTGAGSPEYNNVPRAGSPEYRNVPRAVSPNYKKVLYLRLTAPDTDMSPGLPALLLVQ